MAVALALAFTSCDNTGKGSSSDSSENKSEKVDEAEGPTGDVAKDAKQLCEKQIELMSKNIKSDEEAKQLVNDFKALKDQYMNFYKKKGDDKLNEFNEEYSNLQEDSEYSQKLTDAFNKLLSNEHFIKATLDEVNNNSKP